MHLSSRANEGICCGALADSNDRLFDPIGWIVGRNAKLELVAADYVTIRCIERRTWVYIYMCAIYVSLYCRYVALWYLEWRIELKCAMHIPTILSVIERCSLVNNSKRLNVWNVERFSNGTVMIVDNSQFSQKNRHISSTSTFFSYYSNIFEVYPTTSPNKNITKRRRFFCMRL